jgi:hypothetical protein
MALEAVQNLIDDDPYSTFGSLDGGPRVDSIVQVNQDLYLNIAQAAKSTRMAKAFASRS